MSTSTPLYNQLLSLLSRPWQLLQVGEPALRTASQHAQYQDFRHVKTLAWMINALICSSKINLSEWESYVISRANQAQIQERSHILNCFISYLYRFTFWLKQMAKS